MPQDQLVAKPRLAVYRVEFDWHSFQELRFVDDTLCWSDDSNLDGAPRSPNWQAPKVFSRDPWRRVPDLWNLQEVAGIVLGPEATRFLRPLVEIAGELLPLPFGGRQLSLLNVTQVADCLDYQNIRIKPRNPPARGLHLHSYSFDPGRLPASSIFKIPETAETEVLCAQGLTSPMLDFKDSVGRLGLQGLIFRELWPHYVDRPLVNIRVPQQPRLTRSDLDSAPDEQLDRVVSSALNELTQNARRTGEAAYYKSLNAGLRMVWATDILDGEVRNGGFNQFFWNSHGDIATEAIQGFRLIGAAEHARLVDEAVGMFTQDWHKLEPFYQEGSLSAFGESYEHTDLLRLDHRYLELPDFRPKRISYIREHSDEFVLA